MGLFSRNKKGPTYRYKTPEDQERAFQRLLHSLNTGNVHPNPGQGPPVAGAQAMVADENGVPVFVEYFEEGNGTGRWSGTRGSSGIIGSLSHPPLPSIQTPVRRASSTHAYTALPPRSHPGWRLPAHIPGSFANPDTFLGPNAPVLAARNQQQQQQQQQQRHAQERPHAQAPRAALAPGVAMMDPLVTQQGPLGMYGRRAYVPGQTAVQQRFPGTLTDPGQRYRYLAELERLRRENADKERRGQ